MITFMNPQGEMVTAMDCVTQVTVSASCKRSVAGSFGSSEAFQSFTATIPAELPADTKRQIAQDLYEECQQAVDARLAALVTAPAVPAPAPSESPAPAPAPAAPPPTGETKVLQYAPKAAERQPGQTWTVVCDQYSLSGGTLEFWRQEAQYKDADLTEKSPHWPAAWLEHMTADGKKHEFKKPVAVTCVVSDKKNNKGNYYVNVARLEIVQPQEQAA